jgi:hypothetical protein
LRDKDALSFLNKLKPDDRNLVIKQVRSGDFNFKEFKKNGRKILKELRLKDPKPSEKKDNPTNSTSPEKPVKKTKPPILTRWSLSRQGLVSLMQNSEYMVLLQEHDLETISDETLLEIFEKFKLWLEEQK